MTGMDLMIYGGFSYKPNEPCVMSYVASYFMITDGDIDINQLYHRLSISIFRGLPPPFTRLTYPLPRAGKGLLIKGLTYIKRKVMAAEIITNRALQHIIISIAHSKPYTFFPNRIHTMSFYKVETSFAVLISHCPHLIALFLVSLTSVQLSY